MYTAGLYIAPRVSVNGDVLPVRGFGAPGWIASAEKQAVHDYDLPT